MKSLSLLLTSLAALTFSSAAAAATADAAPRLALWITDPIGMTNGEHCVLPANTALPASAPTVTEKDVVAWQAETFSWTLDSSRFAGSDGAWKLQDHCFVLAVDGKPLASGLALSSYSARLTGLPTLIVTQRKESLTLQLMSGNHVGPLARSLHSDAIGAVLGQPANLEQQLQRSKAGNPQQAGEAWIGAVRKLIEQKEIRQGMPVEDVIKRLGPPTQVMPPAAGRRSTRYHWYFNTPMHVNPAFDLDAEEGMVSSYKIGRR